MHEEPRYKVNLIKPKVKRKERSVGQMSRVWEITLGKLGRKMYRRDNISQQALDILKFVKDNGINAETLISYTVGKKGDMVFLSAGKRISTHLFRMWRVESQEKILRDMLDMIGKLHNLGVVHRHPHLGNLLMAEDGKLVLIDFKKARKVNMVWNNAEFVFNVFREDYFYLIRNLRDLGFTDLIAENFLFTLINRYESNSITKQRIKILLGQLVKDVYDNKRPEEIVFPRI